MSGTVVFEDAKLQAVELIAETVTLNNFSVSTATTFQQTTNASNVTTNTLRFTNPATAFVTTGNVEVGTANLFVDTTTGRVGIGTVSPFEKLDVRGAIIAPVVSYAGNQDAPYLIASSPNYTGATTNWGTYGIQHRIKTDSSGTPRITVDDGNGNEVFTIKNGGNVGIGTTSPLEKLDVHGVSRISSAYPRLDFFCTTGRSTNAWGNSTGAAGDYRIYSNGDASDGTKRSLNFDYGQNTTHTTRMCINAAGNVGIGTNNPRCKLDVQGGGTRCSYPFGIGGSSTYATYTHTGVGGIANNAGSWTKDFVVGSYERGGWIRVYSGATMSTSSAPNGAVQSPKTAEFVYSIYGNSLFWNRVSGSTNISLSSSGYQTIRVTSSGGGSYNHGWVEIWQQGGVAIF